jgi:hypothetical protein
MNYKEVLNRITGFSVPIFGISWNPPTAEIEVARRVLAFLEDRRVLYNPYHIEIEHECVQSVLEIRRFLTGIIGNLQPDSILAAHLRATRTACRAFLDDTNPNGRRIHRPSWSGHSESEFFTALGELRATIGFRIAAIVVMHGLEVEKQLASILPPDQTNQDADESA